MATETQAAFADADGLIVRISRYLQTKQIVCPCPRSIVGLQGRNKCVNKIKYAFTEPTDFNLKAV